MKKSNFLLLYFLLVITITSGQIDVFNKSNLYSEEILFNLIEDDEGDFIMIGKVKESTNINSIGYVMRLTNMGNIKNQFVYNNEGDGLILNDIIFIKNKYIFLGIQQKEDKDYLYISQFDKDFEIIFEKSYQVPNNKQIYYFKTTINSDSNIVIAGHTVEPYYNSVRFNEFYSLLTLDGDSIKIVYKEEPCPTCSPTPYQIHESGDSSKYYVLTSGTNKILGMLEFYNYQKTLTQLGSI